MLKKSLPTNPIQHVPIQLEKLSNPNLTQI